MRLAAIDQPVNLMFHFLMFLFAGGLTSEAQLVEPICDLG